LSTKNIFVTLPALIENQSRQTQSLRQVETGLTFLTEDVNFLFSGGESGHICGFPDEICFCGSVLVVTERLDSALSWELPLE